jgi:GNAT superfamily N-acetyltransferase
MIEIRAARPSDAEAIASLSSEIQAHHANALPQLFKPAAPSVFPPAAVRELLDEPSRVVLVACVDNDVVGYASANIERRAETSFRRSSVSLFVQWMSVRATWRRQGVGRALIAAMREAAAARGIASLALDVWDFNSDARAFYQAVGFRAQRHILSLELDAT